MAWVYRDDPRDWVEYGKYAMRRMDRDRIESGYVVRALVKWWGGTTARPHLWKENAPDTTYRESWDDGREMIAKTQKLLAIFNDARTDDAVRRCILEEMLGGIGCYSSVGRNFTCQCGKHIFTGDESINPGWVAIGWEGMDWSR